MHDEHSNPHSTEHAGKLGYEDTDISIPVLMKWGFFLVVFVSITSVLVLGLYSVLVPQFLHRDANSVPSNQRRLPAADLPQLQPDPVKDIRDYRRREAVHVTGYGTWKDGDGKDAQYIPIDRAMQIVEAKTLPIQSADSAKSDVTLPAIDRGFVDNPLPDGRQPSVLGKVGPENGDNRDETSYTRHTPGM
jgi:hypothetical protein